MKSYSASFRPFQLNETLDGMILTPKDSVWRKMAEEYCTLNNNVIEAMTQHTPEGVRLVELKKSGFGDLLFTDSVEKTTIMQFGKRIADHGLITMAGLHFRIFKTIAAILMNVPNSVFDSQIEFLSEEEDESILKRLRLPSNLVKTWKYDDLQLTGIFEEKGLDLKWLGQYEGITDPRFYALKAVPREWFLDEEGKLVMFVGPQDHLVLDPTQQFAEILGKSQSPEAFDSAVLDLVKVWEDDLKGWTEIVLDESGDEVAQSRFFYNGEFWFGKALQFHLRSYCKKRLVELNEWASMSDFERQIAVANPATGLTAPAYVAKVKGNRNSDDPKIPEHLLGHAQVLGSKVGVKKAIQRFTFMKESEIAGLFN